MNNLKKIFDKSLFTITLRKDDKRLWNDGLNSLDYIPVLYTNESLDFEKEMLSSSQVHTKDISLMFALQGKLICIWPLSINSIENKTYLRTFTSPVLCPLFVNCTNQDIRKKLFNETTRIIKELNYVSNEVEFYLPFLNSINLNYWHSKSLKFAKKNNVDYEIFLKLDKSYDNVRKNFRKGTKSSIKQSERLWNVDILQTNDSITWKKFEKLHLLAAGRKTRSSKSWKIQYENLISGNAFLVFLTNNENEMVGGGFFTCSRDECEYSTGAYNRKLFDLPVGHLVQKAAINEMIKRNIKWYRIGTKALETNEIEPLDKDYSISLFKEGFSSNIFPVIKTKYFFQ